jgi:hypothetical protein
MVLINCLVLHMVHACVREFVRRDKSNMTGGLIRICRTKNDKLFVWWLQ